MTAGQAYGRANSNLDGPVTRVICLSLCLLSACVTVPDLDTEISAAAQAAPYPDLVALGPILAQAGQVTPPDSAGMDARIAALQARAAALRGPVIEPAVRAGMLR